ncbi:MAG: Gx transporter family protein [Christensenellales bacterium]|jgi:heptaprenyl diphosphate synthase|nr:Gx transporter family protein [Clostridiales bacterium]
MRAKKLTLAALLLAVSMIVGIIENLIPPVIPMLPYIKIGLSNMVIIVTIVLLDYKYALAVIALKSIFVPIFVGNPVMILYSLPSSIASTALSSLLIYSKKLGIPSVSMLSAITHNILQLCVAAIMTNYLVFGYLPYFIIIGSVSGFLTGVISYITIKYLPKNLLPR